MGLIRKRYKFIIKPIRKHLCLFKETIINCDSVGNYRLNLISSKGRYCYVTCERKPPRFF